MQDKVTEKTAQDRASAEINNTARILLEVSRLVNSSLDPDEVLQRILNSVDLVLPFDYAVIQILQGDRLYAKTCAGFKHPEQIHTVLLPLAQCPINQEIIETGLPLIIADVKNDKRWLRFDHIQEYKRARSWMGVPLSANGKVIGILELGCNAPAIYQSSHVFFAAAFASHVSIAYENARLYSETRKRMQELAALNKVSAASNHHLGLEELCRLIGETIKSLFSNDIVFIALLDEDKETINTPFFWLEDHTIEVAPFKLGEGLSSIVLQQGKPLLIDHGTEETLTKLGGLRQTKQIPKTWLGLPLLSGKETIGVLSVQSFAHYHYFSNDDISLLTTIAASASSAIQNVRLYKETKRREQEASALAEIGREVSQTLNPETVIKRIVDLAHPLLSKETSAVFVADTASKSLVAVSVAGNTSQVRPGSTVATGVGIIGKTAIEGRVNVDNGLGSFGQTGTEKLMAIPLMANNRILGVLACWRSAAEPAFNRRDIQFADNIARQTSVALRNAQLYQAAEKSRLDAEMANKLKSQFLANMSHELRTPLNSIINFAYLISQEMEHEHFEGELDMLNRIEDSGRHLLSLINDILDLAKIESGRMELCLEELSVSDVVSSVISTIQSLIRDKDIRLLTEIDPGLPTVTADRTRLRQVLLNLVSNSVKFTERGSIRLLAYQEAHFIRVHVIDTGIGIRQEDIARAFDEFVQLDGGSTRLSGGTGLGLPISRRFVEMQGGSMLARSTPGEGSDFSFTVPISRHKAASPAIVAGQNCPDNPGSSGVTKILIIGDDEDSAKVLASQLRRKWDVIQLKDPRMVLDSVRQQKPDAILLDVMMPYIDGWELLKIIKSHPETASLPVIMCSVLHEKNLAMTLQAEDFLVKPVGRDELLQAVANVVPAGGLVLAVDDDHNALDIVDRVLRGEHYEIVSITSSQEGLKNAVQNRPDVILLDIGRRAADGFGVLDALSRHPELSKIPIVAVGSQDLSANELLKLQELKASFLRKGSFTPTELDRILKKAKNRSK